MIDRTMRMASPDINDLIDRWIDGDPEAAAELYERYHARVRHFALKLTRREVDADDLAQEALVAGLEGIKGGQRPDKFTGWIMGVLRNLARRELQGDTRKVRLPERLPVEEKGRDGARTAMIREEMDALLKRMIAGLPAELKEIVRLKFEKGLKRFSLARKVGISREAVDKRFNRAYAILREELSRHFTTLVLSPAGSPPGQDLEKLRPSFREVYRLCQVQGLPVEAAAERLSLPVETVVERLKFAREKMGRAREL